MTTILTDSAMSKERDIPIPAKCAIRPKKSGTNAATNIITVHWRDSYNAFHITRMEIPTSWLDRGKDYLKTLVALKLGQLSTITLIKNGATSFMYRVGG